MREAAWPEADRSSEIDQHHAPIAGKENVVTAPDVVVDDPGGMGLIQDPPDLFEQPPALIDRVLAIEQQQAALDLLHDEAVAVEPLIDSRHSRDRLQPAVGSKLPLDLKPSGQPDRQGLAREVLQDRPPAFPLHHAQISLSPLPLAEHLDRIGCQVGTVEPLECERHQITCARDKAPTHADIIARVFFSGLTSSMARQPPGGG